MKNLRDYIHHPIIQEAEDATSELIERINKGKFKKLSRAGQEKLLKRVEKEVVIYTQKLNVTKPEDTAIDKYISSLYTKINKELRDGKVSKQTEGIVSKIDAAFLKNTLDKEVIVYRGVTGGFKDSGGAYVSTSMSVVNAYNFTGSDGKIIVYKLPKGTPALVLDSYEREVLLPRDLDLSKFEV